MRYSQSKDVNSELFWLLTETRWGFKFNSFQTFFKVKYNFRIIDVISGTILHFTKEEAEVQKQALPFLPARYIRTSEAFSEHERILWLFRNFFVSFC